METEWGEVEVMEATPKAVNADIVVNVWPTKSTPWIVKYYDPAKPNLSAMDDVLDAELLATVKQLVKMLPARVEVPEHYSHISFPRYYYIAVRNGKIADIVGIRHDKTPTSWSWRVGFWHPQITIQIANALDKAIKSLSSLASTS